MDLKPRHMSGVPPKIIPKRSKSRKCLSSSTMYNFNLITTTATVLVLVSSMLLQTAGKKSGCCPKLGDLIAQEIISYCLVRYSAMRATLHHTVALTLGLHLCFDFHREHRGL